MLNTNSESLQNLPDNCTFSESDWGVLSAYWHPVAYCDEVKEKPVLIRLLDEEIVLYRTSTGVTAAKDLCLHRGTPLSIGEVKGDEIVCPYHGYRYNSQGKCTLVPAHPESPIPGQLCLKTYLCQESYGLIWVCLNPQPQGTMVDFPEFDDPEFQIINVPTMDWTVSSGRQIESFSDVAHFAFIHNDTFSREEDAVVPKYQVKATPYGVSADYISTVGNAPRPADTPYNEKDEALWRRVYHIYLPFTVRLKIHCPVPEGGIITILNANSPLSAETSRLFAVVARNFDQDQPVKDVIDFQIKIYSEDRDVVQRQHPERLPLDLSDEVHVRADRTSITYRQELSKLGLGRKFTS